MNPKHEYNGISLKNKDQITKKETESQFTRNPPKQTKNSLHPSAPTRSCMITDMKQQQLSNYSYTNQLFKKYISLYIYFKKSKANLSPPSRDVAHQPSAYSRNGKPTIIKPANHPA